MNILIVNIKCYNNFILKELYFEKLKTIDDYKNNGYEETAPKRDAVRVCFIDDKGFDDKRFRKTGYVNCDVKNDFTNINDFEGYDLIACDIDGIGSSLDKNKQGLAVAETLKSKYPDKIILIYSSNNPYEYAEDYHTIGDGFFNKLKSMNEIAKYFDEKASIYWNEIACWKFIEQRLRSSNIANKTISLIEDIYVRSLEDKTNLFSKHKYHKILSFVAGVVEIAKFISIFVR